MHHKGQLHELNSDAVNELLQAAYYASSNEAVRGVMISSASKLTTEAKNFVSRGKSGAHWRIAEAGKRAHIRTLLRREYALMHSIFELRRKMPVVALADGRISGTGAGLFMAASHRIATPRTSLAFEECSRGMAPGCGATDILQTSSPGLGRWAALTGAHLSAGQMTAAGLCTHMCKGDAAASDSLRY